MTSQLALLLFLFISTSAWQSPARGAPSPGVPSQGVPSQPARNDLKTLGLAYHTYIDVNRSSPSSWDEAEAFCARRGDTASQQALQRMRAAGAVMHWGIQLRECVIGSSNYVLAFEQQTPQQGGWALFLDGSVRYMRILPEPRIGPAVYDPRLVEGVGESDTSEGAGE